MDKKVDEKKIKIKFYKWKKFFLEIYNSKKKDNEKWPFKDLKWKWFEFIEISKKRLIFKKKLKLF
jgi:hypothetical protein